MSAPPLRRPGTRRGRARRAAIAPLLLAAMLAAPARAADPLLQDLEQRLARGGADAVNAHLVARWQQAMVPLNRKAAACELHAVSLSVRLTRSNNARAVGAHGEALRAAAGLCPRFVLALASPAEVPGFCASMVSWGAAQTARELRRRIAGIDADEVLRAGARGRACRAAYVHELEHTRVVVKRAAPDARAAGK